MNGDELCVCGHVADEHRAGRYGLHECEVDGCDCICFDEDPNTEEEE